MPPFFMVDKVKPLKIENPALGGTDTDMFPREADPAQDYIATKGIALENSDARTIDLSGAGQIQFKDAIETTPITVRQLRTALNNLFDNTSNGFISTNVQAAIEEARAEAVANDRYAFLASYGGNANTGRYLEIYPSIGSNDAPFDIPDSSRIITVVLGAVANSTGTVSIYKTSNLATPIASFSLTAQTRADFTGLNIALLATDELAVKVSAGSFNKPFMAIFVSTNA